MYLGYTEQAVTALKGAITTLSDFWHQEKFLYQKLEVKVSKYSSYQR